MSIVLDANESQRTTPSGSLTDVENYREYKYRYVIMALFSGISLTNQLLWVTCTPITTNLMKIYDISQLMVNVSGMMSMFVFIPAAIPGNYLLDYCGIKIGLGAGAILQLAGAWVRMFAGYSFYFVLLGQLLAALAQPVFLDSPQKISAFWTVPKKRTMFTTILTLSTGLGAGIGMLLPGFIVGSEDSPTEGMRLFIRLLLIEAIIATALNVPFFIFYKERPPTPPSASASIPRDKFWKGMKSLIKNKSFLFLLTAQGTAIGLINSLSTVLESLIDPFGYTQVDSSVLGFLILIVGLVGSVALAAFVEKTRKYKQTVAFSNFLGMISCVGFVGILYAENFIALAIITVVLGFFISPMLPLGLEFSAEITFPVGEALSGGAINGLSQITGIAQIFMINGIMTMQDQKEAAVVSMAMLAGWMLLAFICSALVTENLLRSKHDQSHSKKSDAEQQVVKNPETNSEAFAGNSEAVVANPEVVAGNSEAVVANPETNS